MGSGYVDNEEATAATVDSEGWLRTGDLCYIDNEGFLFFVDRLKELIKYKGYQVGSELFINMVPQKSLFNFILFINVVAFAMEQVAPAELEHLLNSHPDVVDSAVVPYVAFMIYLLTTIKLFSLPEKT